MKKAINLLKCRCEYYGSCPLTKKDSYVCNNGGGSYCGKWRELEKMKK